MLTDKQVIEDGAHNEDHCVSGLVHCPEFKINRKHNV
jgi:hypothetical protein